jgi:hypothetical protein
VTEGQVVLFSLVVQIPSDTLPDRYCSGQRSKKTKMQPCYHKAHSLVEETEEMINMI